MSDATILIVEDDRLSVKMLQNAFQKARLKTSLQFAYDGKEAVAYLAGHGKYADRVSYPLPALIFLDLHLPRKSGHDVLAWQRKQATLKHIPVVILSGSDKPADIERAYALGARSYLIKPVSPESLKELVDIFTSFIEDAPRILLLDDDPDIMFLTIRELKKAFPRMEVERVCSAEELPPALERGGYDLVVTDYEMRWTDGLNILRIAKARWPECPVIMFTGSGSEEIAVEAMKAGLEDYIIKKPKHFARLPGSARLALARAKHRRSARQAEARYRQLFDNIPIGLFQCTLGGDFINANPAFCRMLGYADFSELMDTKIANHFLREEDFKKFKITLLKASLVKDVEIQFRQRNGAIRWGAIKASVIFDEAGRKPLSFEGTLEETTTRKRAEAALLESEKKYRTVVENSLVGFYILQDQVFRYVNRRFCDIYGYASDDLVNRIGLMDLVHPDDRDLVDMHIMMPGAGPSHIECEFRGITKSGDFLALKMLGTLLAYNGKPAIAGSIIDISRETLLETELRQAHKMDAVGTLAGGVAHDINNILTVLIGCGSLLQMHIPSDHLMRKYIDQILSSSEKAASLTKSLLAFSRKQPVTLIPLDVNLHIQKTSNILKRLLTEDIELRTVLTQEDTTILADTTQIDQILFNLAANARDAMIQGGMLLIETKIIAAADLPVLPKDIEEPGGYVLLSVSDTGTGMDAKTRERIFDPFFTTKESGKGTGLGLSTVYGIVRQHRGHIHVSSEVGQGTRFDISFPVTGRKNKTIDHAESAPKQGVETILIAEDNDDVRRFIGEILVRQGYSVISAADGKAAVAEYRKHRHIDLLLLDSVMPKKNGREAYDEIAGLNPGIKVLFMSGHTRDVILDRGIEEGKFDFIAKPLLPHELLIKVREVLDRKSKEDYEASL